jgi:uncharacterized protein (DUF4415 family)
MSRDPNPRDDAVRTQSSAPRRNPFSKEAAPVCRRLNLKAEASIAAARDVLKKPFRAQGKGRGAKNVKY